MSRWRFFDYFPEGGGCPIRDWYNQQTVEVQAEFDATVADLAITDNWDDPQLMSFGLFSRNPAHAGLAQVKFRVIQRRDKRNYRALGRWRREAREFIFLTGFQKSGRTRIPENAIVEATRLLRELEEMRGEIRDHDVEEAG